MYLYGTICLKLLILINLLYICDGTAVFEEKMKHIMTEAIGEPTSHKDRSDAVHGSCPQRPRGEFVTCVTSELKYRPYKVVKKDVLLRGTNIKKKSKLQDFL